MVRYSVTSASSQLLATIEKLAGTQRNTTFRMAAELAIRMRPRRIVETGCYRGIQWDGQSTKILSLLGKRIGASVHSVDVSQDSIDRAKSLLGPVEQCSVTFHHSDSVTFLSTFMREIGFLYLDSLDFDPENPDPAQRHQLAEVNAIAPYLATNAIVLLDDSGVPGGGKAMLSTPRLVELGFKIQFDSYQRLLIR